ncbi:MerR family transcriptional regulator [Fictibacillus norfolkensis]|uniref:MerR family transcriptional regulator n=1 Tax=Fictibacillus norfolkensis TaxID=2762233 RepID=A0ABR8SIY9_9BACL|nr:MerR family transcriptional regulator [Fictibacillus norfolkensis]MBD7963440.1 MerR family transcriptional regulator [Fictibacillus norfolkensis]
MNLFSTGEVSKQYGVSVRTLRYYDQIGLLLPSVKSESGTRMYRKEDLHLLEKITLLKSLSLPLTEIKKIIGEVTIKDILVAQKKDVQTQLNQLQSASEKINTLLHILELKGELDWEHILSLVQANEDTKIAEKNQTWETFFSDNERRMLQTSLPKLEDASTAKWVNIIKRIEICLQNNSKPSSAEGHLIASDVLLLSHEMFQGDTELEGKFWNARKSETSSQSLNLYPVSNEVLDFLDRAIISYQTINA